MPVILIVDDSRVARLSLRRMVSAIAPDAEFLEAGSVDEALSVVAGAAIDLAVIDYNMPEKTGLELAEDLRTSAPSARLALCTANIQDAVIERARNLGMTFIPKPPDTAVLTAFITGSAP